VADVDALDEREARVSLMTLHNSKGLEFPVVFIAGMEEGIFPHPLSLEDDEEMEEERRLFYVGLTRAKDRVLLSAARSRLRFGERTIAVPSRFLREIPAEHREDRGARSSFEWGPPRERTFARDAATRSPGSRRPAPRGATERHDLFDDAGGVEATRGEPVFDDDGREARLRVGERVRHPLFGIGQVMETSGHGQSLKVTIQFGHAGRRKLMAAYASLERIG
jgi:DNA helicase-2/ATP-dependent DNA helicase PcrA